MNSIWEWETLNENQVKQLVDRGMWILVMVLVGMEVMKISWGYERR